MSEHNLDHSREERLGFPEIVYGEFKNTAQINAIILEYQSRKQNILITRLQAEKAQELIAQYPIAIYDELARTFVINYSETKPKKGLVGIVSGGTSDTNIVRETNNTLNYLAYETLCFNDIGVAGIHRLMEKKDALSACDIIIAVAGFEGALASVVGGILSQPIIAVPTSVGYGVAAGGTTALHAMLTSCANGILVTNIDNGCGAALAAARILQKIYP